MSSTPIRTAEDGAVIADLALLDKDPGREGWCVGESCRVSGEGFSFTWRLAVSAWIIGKLCYLYMPSGKPMAVLQKVASPEHAALWQGHRYFDLKRDGMTVERGVVFRLIELPEEDGGVRYQLECEGFGNE